MPSNFKMLSTKASSSRATDGLDGDTATLVRARRAVGDRLVSPWSDYSRLVRPDQRHSAWGRVLGSYAQCRAFGVSLRGAKAHYNS